MPFERKAWLRWPLAILAVAMAFRLGAREPGVGGVTALWAGVFLLVVAAVCVSPEVIALVAAPITRWAENLYLPGGRPEPPPLNFRLVRYYQLTQQYALAVEEYHRMIKDHPREAEAYEGLVRLLVNEFDDRRTARRWLKRGLRRVKDRAQRARLREEFRPLLEPEDFRISV